MDNSASDNLKKLISDRIRQRGPITFAEFMEACLYEPGLGYYTSAGRKVGAEGDFYTSINVHQIFGRVIARELHRMWEEMGRPSSFSLVEPGAAGGVLAEDILGALKELDPVCYGAVTYRLIEREPSLRQAQQQRLAAHGGHVAWHDPAELEKGELTFTGCLLSNELLDSFPVHLVQMTDTGLKEVFVDLDDAGDAFAEVLREPSTSEIPAYLQRLGIALHPGQRAEINLAAVRWLKSVAAALVRGFVLTIDYGYPARELYSPMRRTGTLLCYWRHTSQENPYIRVGEQDITSHVDFTTLIDRGEEFGLKKAWFGEQYRFLIAAGLMEELAAFESSAATEEQVLKLRLTVKKLILPEGGMGDTFKVLIQYKGIEEPHLLCMRDWASLL